jgi:hypothetical protein
MVARSAPFPAGRHAGTASRPVSSSRRTAEAPTKVR